MQLDHRLGGGQLGADERNVILKRVHIHTRRVAMKALVCCHHHSALLVCLGLAMIFVKAIQKSDSLTRMPSAVASPSRASPGPGHTFHLGQLVHSPEGLFWWSAKRCRASCHIRGSTHPSGGACGGSSRSIKLTAFIAHTFLDDRTRTQPDGDEVTPGQGVPPTRLPT
ncbi:MAG: hypothetical protein HOV79_27255 [Hamadaea sp.]|nr:hypothetical protein [Hamadaea sp.]